MTTPSYTFPLVDAPPPPSSDLDTQTISAIAQLKRNLLLDTADGDALTVVGNNYGVPRPPASPEDDELYRRCVAVLAWQPKTIAFTTHALLAAVFGSQSTLAADGLRPWKIYEPNANEFVLEIPMHLIAASNENASYVHGISGYASVTVAGFSFTTPGDIAAKSATSLVGKLIQVYHSGAWNNYTVGSATYNVGTGLTTVGVTPLVVAIPAGGGLFHIVLEGDGTTSYPGDYVAPSKITSSFKTVGGGFVSKLFAVGDVSPHLAVGAPIFVVINGVSTQLNVTAVDFEADLPGYTTVDVSAAVVPGSITSTFQTREHVAGSSTPEHDLRVYFTGLGLLEVVKYYMNLLVRAAGIVMRIELI